MWVPPVLPLAHAVMLRCKAVINHHVKLEADATDTDTGRIQISAISEEVGVRAINEEVGVRVINDEVGVRAINEVGVGT